MSDFRSLVFAALDAGDIEPDSQAGRIALSHERWVGETVRRAGDFAEYYRTAYYPRCQRMPVPKCPQLAAVNLVLLAIDEAARGVRAVLQ